MTKANELVVVERAGEPRTFKLSAPPWDPNYHEHSAGLVGDYRPLAVRLAEKKAKETK